MVRIVARQLQIEYETHLSTDSSVSGTKTNCFRRRQLVLILLSHCLFLKISMIS